MLDVIKEYLLQNWALLLILSAFAIMLRTSIYFDRRMAVHTYVLIGSVFALSIVVFAEFYLDALGGYGEWRTVLMAVRYSATPFITAHVIFTLIKRQRWFIFLPAVALAAINVVSVFTGIVFSVDEQGVFHRGVLGLLPFIVAGVYFVVLAWLLVRRSNKRMSELVPIGFLCLAFTAGLVLPFVFGKEYAGIFCTTIAVALFVYYVFSILNLTKKDPLTGLLNRQAYYADVAKDAQDVTALVSLDMNGLKPINDTHGHAAGDEALLTLSLCFMRAARRKQAVYRVGGDEFVIVCRRTTRAETERLVERVRRAVAETPYFCSVGYSVREDASKSIDTLLRESDEMMYAEKASFYQQRQDQA